MEIFIIICVFVGFLVGASFGVNLERLKDRED
jgi:hypothetical protein